MKITNVDAVAGIEMFDRVDPHTLAEKELVVAFVATELVATGTAEQQIPSRATE
jgi:hypothetical protein